MLLKLRQDKLIDSRRNLIVCFRFHVQFLWRLISFRRSNSTVYSFLNVGPFRASAWWWSWCTRPSSFVQVSHLSIYSAVPIEVFKRLRTLGDECFRGQLVSTNRKIHVRLVWTMIRDFSDACSLSSYWNGERRQRNWTGDITAPVQHHHNNHQHANKHIYFSSY